MPDLAASTSVCKAVSDEISIRGQAQRMCYSGEIQARSGSCRVFIPTLCFLIWNSACSRSGEVSGWKIVAVSVHETKETGHFQEVAQFCHPLLVF